MSGTGWGSQPTRIAGQPPVAAAAGDHPTSAPGQDGEAALGAAFLRRDPEPAVGRSVLRDLGRTPSPALTGYRWPVENARITNAFGVGRPGSEVVDARSMHDGIDISSFCGAHVVAAHDGVVLAAGRHHEAFVGWIGDLEPYRARLDSKHAWGGVAIAVVVDDGNGYRSIYLHLNLATVKAGDAVQAGDMLGYQGSTGIATGCHLHYAIFSPAEQQTIAFDPKLAARLRLPPLKLARIDPLLVLPPPAEAGITWGWGSGKPS